MAVQESTKILDEKIRAMAEDFDTKLGEAFNRAVEGFQGRVESLIERFGAPAVGARMKRYPISTPGGTLYAVFRPMVCGGDQYEESWDVDEEV
jgi:hypothetical protein